MSVTNFVDDRQRVPTDPTSVPTDPPLSNSTFGGRVGEVQAVKRAWCLEPNKQSFLSGDFGSGWTTIVPPQKCHGPRLVQQMQLCCDKRPAAAAAAVGVGVGVGVVVVVEEVVVGGFGWVWGINAKLPSQSPSPTPSCSVPHPLICKFPWRPGNDAVMSKRVDLSRRHR